MIDRKAFAKMRKENSLFDERRECLIKQARDVLRQSKAAIYAIHRDELEKAGNLLKAARGQIAQINKIVKNNKRLSATGAYSEALEEYVEGECYYGFIRENKLPTAMALKVNSDIYLLGLCDLVGELVRKAINSAIKEDYKTAFRIREFVSEVYGELMLFDFRNAPVRRKFDSIKYGLEKLEDLALKLKLKGK